MIKKTITYTDYNGVERTETHRFHFTQAEIAKMELSVVGGYAEMIKKIIAAQDTPTLANIFADLIEKSYGVMTPDGKGFDKDPKHLKEFMQTEAYSQLYMELATNTDEAIKFVNGIMPANAGKKAAAPVAVAPVEVID